MASGIKYVTKSGNFSTYQKRINSFSQKWSGRKKRILSKVRLKDAERALENARKILEGKSKELKYLTYFFVRWIYNLGKDMGDESINTNDKKVLCCLKDCSIDKNGKVSNKVNELKKLLKLCYEDMQKNVESIKERRNKRKELKKQKRESNIKKAKQFYTKKFSYKAEEIIKLNPKLYDSSKMVHFSAMFSMLNKSDDPMEINRICLLLTRGHSSSDGTLEGQQNISPECVYADIYLTNCLKKLGKESKYAYDYDKNELLKKEKESIEEKINEKISKALSLK